RVPGWPLGTAAAQPPRDPERDDQDRRRDDEPGRHPSSGRPTLSPGLGLSRTRPATINPSALSTSTWSAPTPFWGRSKVPRLPGPTAWASALDGLFGFP